MCSILIGKFTNTFNFTNDIKPSPMHSITSKSGGMPPCAIYNISGVSGGRVYDDVITFSNKALAKLSNVTYTFTYDKDMCIGSKIKLNLPSWSGTASSVSIANGCGSSKFTVQDVPGYCEDPKKSNVSSCSLSSNMWRKEVIITVVSRPLIHDTHCALMISGLQTPVSKRFTRIYQVSQSFDLTLCSSRWNSSNTFDHH